MKKLYVALCIALAMAILPSVASAQTAPMANSPKASLYTSDPMVIGATTIKPGDYKVQCQTIDGKEYLVVMAASDNKEVARVPCTPGVLAAKVKETQFLAKAGPGGARVLTSVRIKGETVEHLVVGATS
jgi:hypothetical protein